MKDQFKESILSLMSKSNKVLQLKDLKTGCRVAPAYEPLFMEALEELEQEAQIVQKAGGFLTIKAVGLIAATVVRIHKTFGFVRRVEDSIDMFIPGKFLMGAMPGDYVQVKEMPSRTGSPEGQIVKVTKENKSRFTGVVVEERGVRMIQPDTFTKTPITLIKAQDYALGEKIMAEIFSRGSRHSEHKAIAIAGFGQSDKAASCAQSILALYGATPEFPAAVMKEAEAVDKAGIDSEEVAKRVDLRDKLIFTIDSADTKDIDDAISLEVNPRGGWQLGVHIADVSHYVRPGMALDDEAFERGTSIYYADQVLPMLPKQLSNGICSLNPLEDRLAFSCFVDLSPEGELLDYQFKKTVICSKVKGVYAEINEIFKGGKNGVPENLKAKYADSLDTLFEMHGLAKILIANRVKRGAPQLETSESKLIMDENGICVDVQGRKSGESENMIEEFMLMANTAAAKMGKENMTPFVYRIHENPPLEKVDNFKEAMGKLGVTVPHFTDIKPIHMAEVLESSRGSTMFPVVNRMVLRSMAKAKYSTDPIGHFGLVLADYAHFTSPIRRYPDLCIHRILTDILSGADKKALTKRYAGFAGKTAQHSSDTEGTAMRIERDCEDCYKAEYMSQHIGETFDGVISGTVDYGFYVELPNTVEGLVHVSALPQGDYEFDGMATLNEKLSGKSYRIGQPVRVLCTKADVSGGKVDFSLEV